MWGMGNLNSFFGDKHFIRAYELEKHFEELPLIVKAELERNEHCSKNFKLLMSLSFFCWGGLKLRTKTGESITWICKPNIMYEYYINFTIMILTALKSFDRSKGNWGGRVRDCRMGAITMTARGINRVKNLEAMFDSSEDIYDMAETTTYEDIENAIFTARQAKSVRKLQKMPDGLIHAFQYNVDFDSFTLCKFTADGLLNEIQDGLEYHEVKYVEEV
jgi:hypothetical protein